MPDPTGEREPYELEPGAEPTPPAGKPPPPPGASGARIAADPLLASFPKDADFTTDPELERAIAGPPKPGDPVKVAVELPEIVKPGLGDAKVWGIVGGVLTAATVIAIIVNARPIAGLPAAKQPDPRWFLGSLLAVYNIALHTGTGVVAVYAAALLSERRVTRVELVAARMLAAVSAFALLTSLRIDPWGDRMVGWKTEEFLLGTAAYLAIVALLFRLPRTLLMYVVGSHFVLWLVVQLGMELSRAVGAGGK